MHCSKLRVIDRGFTHGDIVSAAPTEAGKQSDLTITGTIVDVELTVGA